jgi:hypothetical protein
MMVDKRTNAKTKIYLPGGYFCRRFTPAFLVEFCRHLDGNWNQYFICRIGVLVLSAHVARMTKPRIRHNSGVCSEMPVRFFKIRDSYIYPNPRPKCVLIMATIKYYFALNKTLNLCSNMGNNKILNRLIRSQSDVLVLVLARSVTPVDKI